jgi:phosphoglycerol transferase MdoB-like AlkP superfamily enzyme
MQKAIFEWKNPVIPHSEDAVQATQHFANHFIRFVVAGCNLLFIVYLKLGNTYFIWLFLGLSTIFYYFLWKYTRN